MTTTKTLKMAAAVILMVSCAKTEKTGTQSILSQGSASVSVRFDDRITKSSTTGYVTSLKEEEAINKIDILVFDKETKNLNSIKSIDSLEDSCKFTLPVGEKIFYAIINGPELNEVRNIDQLNRLEYKLENRSIAKDGLTLIGSTECNISKETDANPVINVRWMESRVVLQKVTCNLPSQHKNMVINSVFLGNANTVQTFGGVASAMVNRNGYEDGDASKPIGTGDYIGECPEYMFRSMKTSINTGDFSDTKIHMYCQPNHTQEHTCLYLLTTISEKRYYYRVPLNQGLTANSTCSVELKITNLGSTTPPVGNYESDTVTALISIEGWTPGHSYEAEF